MKNIVVIILFFLFSGCFSPINEVNDVSRFNVRTTQSLAPRGRYLLSSVGPVPEYVSALVTDSYGRTWGRTNPHTGHRFFVSEIRPDRVSSVISVEVGDTSRPSPINSLIALTDGSVVTERSLSGATIREHNDLLNVSIALHSFTIAENILQWQQRDARQVPFELRGFGLNNNNGSAYISLHSSGYANYIIVYDRGMPDLSLGGNIAVSASRVLEIGPRHALNFVTLLTSGGGSHPNRMYAVLAQGLMAYGFPVFGSFVSSSHLVFIDNASNVTLVPLSANESVRAMVYDSSGDRLLLATNNGLQVRDALTGALLRTYTQADGLSGNDISALAVSPTGAILLAHGRAALTLIDGNSVEHYPLNELYFSGHNPYITAITYNAIQGFFYVGSNTAEVVALGPRIRGGAEANNNLRRDEHSHRVIARKGADRHSSILPHPPRIAIPQSLHSESWGHWFKKLGCSLISFESSDSNRGYFFCVGDRNPRSADRQND